MGYSNEEANKLYDMLKQAISTVESWMASMMENTYSDLEQSIVEDIKETINEEMTNLYLTEMEEARQQ